MADMQDYSVRRGDDSVFPITVENADGTSADLSQVSAARFTYGYSQDGAPLATKILGSGLTQGTAQLPDGTSVSAILASLPSQETLQLEAYRTYYYQVRLTFPDGTETVLTGSFPVQPSQDETASALVVEDGSGLPNAASYVGLAEADAYHLSNGSWFDTDVSPQAKMAALVRATRYVDGAYRYRFSGLRLRQRDQALEWPRQSAVAMGQYPIGANEIPRELRAAVCEAALRELGSPGALSPDLSAPVSMVQADTVQVQFAGAGYTAAQSFPVIDMLLVPILMPMNALSGKAGRG